MLIDWASGRVQILGSTPHPDDLFMRQVGRTLTAADDDVGRPAVLICDRDRKWSLSVRGLLDEAGMRVVQTPVRAPNANAYAERFVRTIKDERLGRVILCGERHLRRTISEFVAHYHAERNHQGLGNALIAGDAARHPAALLARVSLLRLPLAVPVDVSAHQAYRFSTHRHRSRLRDQGGSA